MIPIVRIGLKHQLNSSARTLHGLLGVSLRRPCALGCPVITGLQTTNIRQDLERQSSTLRGVADTQGSRFLYNRPRVPERLESWKKVSPFGTRAFDDSRKSHPSLDGTQFDKRRDGGNFLVKFLRGLIKTMSGLLLAALLVIAALPSFLSWSPSQRLAISLANKSIPGTVNVSSVSLGWTQPVHIAGLSLQGTDGENVLLIPKLETKAPLWSIFLGKSGLGDCTVTSPVIDLQQHPKNSLPHLALALASSEKLLARNPRATKPGKQLPVPPADASLAVQVKAPRGGFQINDARIIFPSDVVAVLGGRLFINVGVGPFATTESDELKDAEGENEGLPLVAFLWSENVQAEAAGFLQTKSSKFKLVKPLKAEMDLTPAVAKFYLARVNPLLGEIVGPAIHDEDMPDVTVLVTPTDLELPAVGYRVNIAPMKVTLARGEILDGVLSLLSKQDLASGNRDLTMQTSAIEANVRMPSSVESSRLDVLIADKIHLATWGTLDWIDETVQIILAIPGDALRDLLGLKKVPVNYYLEIPVSGTLQKTKVDWRTAAVRLAELTARQWAGSFFFDSSKSTSNVPKPIGVLPWEVNSPPTIKKT